MVFLAYDFMYGFYRQTWRIFWIMKNFLSQINKGIGSFKFLIKFQNFTVKMKNQILKSENFFMSPDFQIEMKLGYFNWKIFP